MENIQRSVRQSLVEEFRAKYGVDHGTAEVLFRDPGPLPKMIQHMYLDTMEELRECDIEKDGKRIQGMAQLLWTMLNIPGEVQQINEINETEMP